MKKLIIGLIFCFTLALLPTCALVGCGNGTKENATAGKKYAVTFVFDENHRSVSLVASGKKAKEPIKMTKAGYAFDAWYIDEAKTQLYDFSKAVKKNITLYARLYDNKISLSTTDSNAYVSGIKANSVSVTIPEVFNGKSVTEIGRNAFVNSSLQVLTIPNSVTKIGENAFKNCTDLISITIGNGVTQIYPYAFAGCTNLNNVIIPNSVTTISKYAFFGCTSLSNVIFGNQLEIIEQGAFKNCLGIRSINIPAKVSNIGDFAFLGCQNLESITVSAQNTIYDSRENCNAIIKSNTVMIGCKNTTFPQSVIAICEYAFKGCTGLVEIEIPSTIKFIGHSAFADCNNLESITVPFIGNGQCDIPNARYYDALSDYWKYNVRYGYTSEYDSRCYSNSYMFYSIFGYLKQYSYTFQTAAVIPESLKNVTVTGGKITDSAFYGAKNIESITITNSATKVGSAAFVGCSALVNLLLPSTITEFEDGAFGSCTSLTSITIADNVNNIGGWTFLNCTSLETVIIKNADVYSFVGSGFDSSCVLDYATNVYVLKSIDNASNNCLNSNYTKASGTGDYSDYYIYTRN